MGYIVDIVFFDFAKAFDVFLHHLLLGKLRLLGIFRLLTYWIVVFFIGHVMRFQFSVFVVFSWM